MIGVGIASATSACGRLSIPTESGGTLATGASPAGLAGPKGPGKARIERGGGFGHADSFYSELGTRKQEAPDRVPRFGRKVRKLNPW